MMMTLFAASSSIPYVYAQNTEEGTDKKKESKYEKLFKDKKVETAKSDFITLHKIDSKVYFELPLKYLGDEMLFGATVSSVSDGRFITVGMKNADPINFRFEKDEEMILMKKPNDLLSAYHPTKALKSALDINYNDPTIAGFKIEAYNADSTAVVFDMSSFVARHNSSLSVIPKYSGSFAISASPVDMNYVKSVKSFDNNISIRTELNFLLKVSLMGMVSILNDMPTTIDATFSIVRLPKESMTPRIADARVGYFSSGKYYFPEGKDGMDRIHYVHRWRLEPKDPKAYAAGNLTEPVQPIVYYIDSAFPEAWKEPVRRGVERWNKAFERIGFKGAIIARDFPKDDPSFDPDNLKYSCIRYIPNSTENAMGPSWIDPKSGEILNASILVYSNIEQLLYKWRFVQTANVDPRVRGIKLPKEVLDESLEYVIAHEVGHTLGLMHNMGASSAYPTESLRSAAFTKEHGTTPSIMDYARFNYIAQPSDKGVSLTPPELGVYDYYAIDWGYRYFPQFQADINKQAKELEKFVDEKTKDLKYRYKPQQFGHIIDPYAIAEDLGNDPLKSSKYGINNLKGIQRNLTKWIVNDEDSKIKRSLNLAIAQQYFGYVKNVMNLVGGVSVNISKESSGIPRYEVVSKAKQREAFLWAFDQVKNFTKYYADRELERKGFLEVSFYDQLLEFMTQDLYRLRARVIIGQHLSPASYTQKEFCDDLYAQLFKNTMAGAPLSKSERFMQRAFVDNATAYIVSGAPKNGLPMPSLTDATTATDVYFHFMDKLGYLPKSVYESLQTVSFGNPDENIYPSFNIGLFDEGQIHFHQALLKLQPLLKQRIESTSDALLKAHYRSMLYKVNNALNPRK